MSIKQKNSDTAAPKGSAWKKNVIFALVVLALAAGVFLAVRAQHPAKGSGLQAVVDFGDGVTETLPLAQDHDYLYEVGDYIVHLQVKDGAIAFLDSQCPDHVCEQFGWLDKDGAWAACVPVPQIGAIPSLQHGGESGADSGCGHILLCAHRLALDAATLLVLDDKYIGERI